MKSGFVSCNKDLDAINAALAPNHAVWELQLSTSEFLN